MTKLVVALLEGCDGVSGIIQTDKDDIADRADMKMGSTPQEIKPNEKKKKAPGFFKEGNPYGKRFEKGVSGNPGGRPKTVANKTKEMLAVFCESADELVKATLAIAQNEDLPAKDRYPFLRDCLDRVMGKPTSKMLVTTSDNDLSVEETLEKLQESEEKDSEIERLSARVSSLEELLQKLTPKTKK